MTCENWKCLCTSHANRRQAHSKSYPEGRRILFANGISGAAQQESLRHQCVANEVPVNGLYTTVDPAELCGSIVTRCISCAATAGKSDGDYWAVTVGLRIRWK
jgi:hypothetical protein